MKKILILFFTISYISFSNDIKDISDFLNSNKDKIFVARGGRGGGRSFSSRGSLKSSSGSWGKSSSSKSSSKGSSWGSNKSQSAKTSTPKSMTGGKTRSQINSKKSVYKNGNKVFKSRQEAVNDFKSKNDQKYKNHFDSKPNSRPSYIPESATVGGHNVNIFYNPNTHAYGYTNPLTHAFIAYSVFKDAAMLSMLMNHNGYQMQNMNPYHHGGFFTSFLSNLIILVLVFLFFVFIFKFFFRRK